jgi:hypothetical protein
LFLVVVVPNAKDKSTPERGSEKPVPSLVAAALLLPQRGRRIGPALSVALKNKMI